MRTMHVTGRLEIRFIGGPDAPRHAMRLNAGDDAIAIEVDSPRDLFAFRRALPGLRAVRHGLEVAPRALNVLVNGTLVACWRSDRATGWLERLLGVDPLELRWAGLLRVLFLPRG